MEERLDKLLIQRNLVSNRSEAEKVIRESGVKVNGKLETKTGKRFPIDAEISIPESNWIAKDALKLVEAQKKWSLIFENKITADFGSGQGGCVQVFTNENAKKVYAIDREPNLLSDSLEVKNVIPIGGKSFRELNKVDIPDFVDIAILDVENTSAKELLPFVHEYISSKGNLICVLKPQLEILDKKYNKGGVVKMKHGVLEIILDHFKESATLNNFNFIDHTTSPYLSESGNFEIIVLLKKR